MEALVIIGVFSSFGLSVHNMFKGVNDVYFDSIAVIVSFMLLGKMIESKVKFSSKEVLHKIIKTLPKRARKKFEDGSVKFVPLKEVKINDTIMAFSGEKVVMDGVLIEGDCSIDESLITGESKPVYKSKGDSLVGGSIVTTGNISYSVSKIAGDTTLDKIVQLVQEEIKHKALYERAADHIVRYFVPFVIFTSLLNWLVSLFFFQEAGFVNSVSLLLIACPCALGIAAPLAESKMLYEIMQLGAFVKNRGVLKVLPKINSFVFDKTGTVTKGTFSVLEGIESLSNHHKSLLKALSEKSSHPISRAIHEHLECIETLPLQNIEEHSGKGMKATYKGQVCLLGSKNLLQENLRIVERDPQDTFTTVYFSPSENEIFYIKLGDTIKEEVYALINELPGDKILLSGDSENVVADIAKKLNFKVYQDSYLPHMKKDYVEELRKKNKIVCMIGDGINDAPAIAAANVGISVIHATDLSSQVSDILLTVDKVSILTEILKIAKKGDMIIKQNLFWAFFYNIIGMGLAITGNLTPLYSAIAMVLSSFIVIINSKRV
jgi:heavy metal translocating P-type ATPase